MLGKLILPSTRANICNSQVFTPSGDGGMDVISEELDGEVVLQINPVRFQMSAARIGRGNPRNLG